MCVCVCFSIYRTTILKKKSIVGIPPFASQVPCEALEPLDIQVGDDKDDMYSMNYQTKHKPCDFMQEDGNCKLGDCKPDS